METTETPTVNPITPSMTLPVSPTAVAKIPETTTPEQVEQPQTQQTIDATYPELITYALVVYGFYYAAKYTKDAIMKGDPSANGLFKVVQLNYKVTIEDLNQDDKTEMSDAENDRKLLDKALNPDARAIVNRESVDTDEKEVEEQPV
jgi:hypothetical protein